jgi:sterol desaturase/sphingolipid hydroxylase (fatty acid hydroxylase superfamily)
MEPRLLFTVVVSALHTGTLLLVWGAASALHARGAFASLRVSGGEPPDAALARSARREVLQGQLLFAVLVYLAVYPLWTLTGGRMQGAASPPQIAGHLLAFILFEDTIFYWAHRALHTRWLFHHVHSRHHRFRRVRGYVAEYAHPLENAINFVAFFAGPIALGSPFGIVAGWIVLRMFETVEAHSGYTFTGSSSRHAFHHLHAQRGCYGSFFSPWDRLLGTDRLWRQQREQSREQPHAHS